MCSSLVDTLPGRFYGSNRKHLGPPTGMFFNCQNQTLLQEYCINLKTARGKHFLLSVTREAHCLVIRERLVTEAHKEQAVFFDEISGKTKCT